MTTTTARNNHSNVEKQNYTNKGFIHDKIYRIYHSALLDKAFKPTTKSLELTPKLEPLWPIILLQHKVFIWIYHSALLDKAFKPTTKSMELTPKLEPLYPSYCCSMKSSFKP